MFAYVFAVVNIGDVRYVSTVKKSAGIKSLVCIMGVFWEFNWLKSSEGVWSAWRRRRSPGIPRVGRHSLGAWFARKENILRVERQHVLRSGSASMAEGGGSKPGGMVSCHRGS